MNFDWSPEDISFRDEVRAFLADNITPEIKACGEKMTSVYAEHSASMKWQKILLEKGWVAPSWPKKYGGCEWTGTQRYIYTRERTLAGAPPTSPMGIDMVAHAIIEFGTEEQKQFFLPRMLSGEHFWCQGYSEPSSGSDLASLQMSGVVEGKDIICNGAKIWQTHAMDANWVFCLIRTSGEGKKQQGITFLLMDMSTPGITVKPIVMTSGEKIQSQIFFDNVKIPKDNVLGAINDGWTVAKYLLEFERGGSAYTPGLKVRLEKLRDNLKSQLGDDDEPLINDPMIAMRLAETKVTLDSLEVLEFRINSALSSGQNAGVAASMLKILGTELSQDIGKLAYDAAGIQGLPYQPHAASPGGPIHDFNPPETGYISGKDWQAIAPLYYFNDRAGTIYAGSNEIQRNILAKAQLRL